MQFILTGFTQDLGCRVFAFEGVAPDRIRTAFTVRADLALSRRYGIQMQDLPLLCRSLLERSDDDNKTLSLTFSEDQMRSWANERAVARDIAALKKKPPRRPVVDHFAAPKADPAALAASAGEPTLGT